MISGHQMKDTITFHHTLYTSTLFGISFVSLAFIYNNPSFGMCTDHGKSVSASESRRKCPSKINWKIPDDGQW